MTGRWLSARGLRSALVVPTDVHGVVILDRVCYVLCDVSVLGEEEVLAPALRWPGRMMSRRHFPVLGPDDNI